MKKILLIVVIIFSQTATLLAQWESMGTGINGTVSAIAVLNNTVYAGGSFGGGVKSYNESTQSWSTAGDGINGTINALTVHQGKLYAGGSFLTSGSNVTCNNIAVYNPSNQRWEAVLSGFNNFVRALYSDGTNLYAGGSFFNSGSPAVSRIAQYSTTGWIPQGDPGGVVSAITKFYGKLHVAGNFSLNLLAVYNGNTWDKYGSGIISGVESKTLAVYDDHLYVGGDFNGIAYGLVKFKNGSFTVPFNQLNNYVKSLLATPSRLFGGGAFTATTSGSALNHFFRYDGALPFSDFGGTNGSVLALANYNGRVVAGGTFTTAGGLTVSNIARTTSTIDIAETAPVILTSVIYPNPVIEKSTISISTNQQLQQPGLRILDPTGKCVADIPTDEVPSSFGYTFTIDRSRFAAGLYYYVLTDGTTGTFSGKFLIQ